MWYIYLHQMVFFHGIQYIWYIPKFGIHPIKNYPNEGKYTFVPWILWVRFCEESDKNMIGVPTLRKFRPTEGLKFRGTTRTFSSEWPLAEWVMAAVCFFWGGAVWVAVGNDRVRELIMLMHVWRCLPWSCYSLQLSRGQRKWSITIPM